MCFCTNGETTYNIFSALHTNCIPRVRIERIVRLGIGPIKMVKWLRNYNYRIMVRAQVWEYGWSISMGEWLEHYKYD